MVSLLQGKSPSPRSSLSLCIFVFHPHRHTHRHTKQQANELFASMCCLHHWTEQQQAQRPPLKGRDPLDNPSHCVPRSLVPQCCRISTHTSGLVASCGSGWAHCGWLVGRIDACRFLAGWQTASSVCPRVHM